MYYKGQAISQLARCYAERGDMETAQKWALKSVPIFDSSEVISALIDKGDDLLSDVAFCTCWFLEELFYMACRIDNDDSLRSNCGQICGQKIFGISGGAEVVEKHAILPRKCKK